MQAVVALETNSLTFSAVGYPLVVRIENALLLPKADLITQDATPLRRGLFFGKDSFTFESPLPIPERGRVYGWAVLEVGAMSRDAFLEPAVQHLCQGSASSVTEVNRAADDHTAYIIAELTCVRGSPTSDVFRLVERRCQSDESRVSSAADDSLRAHSSPSFSGRRCPPSWTDVLYRLATTTVLRDVDNTV